MSRAVIAQGSPQAPQGQPNAQAQQQIDLAALQHDDNFASDLRTLSSDAHQAGPDLATTKSDATLGTDCYNVSTVKLDASNVGADASIVSLDLDSLTADIGTATQDMATMKNDLANLSTSGLPAPPGAPAAIAAAGKAIRQAAAKANDEIDQVNADVTQAYSVANGMAAGSCSRDGLGHPPAPIRQPGAHHRRHCTPISVEHRLSVLTRRPHPGLPPARGQLRQDRHVSRSCL